MLGDLARERRDHAHLLRRQGRRVERALADRDRRALGDKRAADGGRRGPRRQADRAVAAKREATAARRETGIDRNRRQAFDEVEDRRLNEFGSPAGNRRHRRRRRGAVDDLDHAPGRLVLPITLAKHLVAGALRGLRKQGHGRGAIHVVARLHLLRSDRERTPGAGRLSRRFALGRGGETGLGLLERSKRALLRIDLGRQLVRDSQGGIVRVRVVNGPEMLGELILEGNEAGLRVLDALGKRLHGRAPLMEWRSGEPAG